MVDIDQLASWERERTETEVHGYVPFLILLTANVL